MRAPGQRFGVIVSTASGSAAPSAITLDWLDRQPAANPTPLNLSLIIGPETPQLLANIARNLRERRIRLFQIVVSKPPV